jgi:hypothetical protein
MFLLWHSGTLRLLREESSLPGAAGCQTNLVAGDGGCARGAPRAHAEDLSLASDRTVCEEFPERICAACSFKSWTRLSKGPG